MSDDVKYQSNWPDESTQCHNCQSYQEHDGKKACVPKDKTFEQALEAYGEVEANAHCNSFQAK